jgi:hypothetical protein
VFRDLALAADGTPMGTFERWRDVIAAATDGDLTIAR